MCATRVSRWKVFTSVRHSVDFPVPRSPVSSSSGTWRARPVDNPARASACVRLRKW
ncbi:MAG: hypothetical protein R2712_20055 [Vicinamibacterales bacterium]